MGATPESRVSRGRSFEESAILYRVPEVRYPVLVRGEGYSVWDENGDRYVDLSSGLASPVGLGHGRGDIAAVMEQQARTLAFVNNARVTTDKQEELAHRLTRLLPEGIGRVMFSSGGSEANEIAIRIARQYHLSRGDADRWKVISLEPSYHGATAAAMAVSARQGLAVDYEPYLVSGGRLQAPIRFRGRYQGLDDESMVFTARDDLVALFKAEGPGAISALIGEAVSSTAGMAMAPPGYWPMIREVCDEYGALIIMDEAVTGMGRTGHILASPQFGLIPDLVSIAKGIAGGYVPMAATLVHDRVTRSLVDSGRGMAAVHAHAGNALACAVALEVLDIIERESVLATVTEAGRVLEKLLEVELGDLAIVGETRGMGLMRTVELVLPGTRSVIPAKHRVASRLWSAMLDRGFLLPVSRYHEQLVGDCVNFYPIFRTDDETLTAAVGALRDALGGLQSDIARG